MIILLGILYYLYHWYVFRIISIWSKLIGKVYIILISSCMVESIQVIFKVGIFDIDDILLNTIGGTMGIVVYKCLFKLFNNHRKS